MLNSIFFFLTFLLFIRESITIVFNFHSARSEDDSSFIPALFIPLSITSNHLFFGLPHPLFPSIYISFTNLTVFVSLLSLNHVLVTLLINFNIFISATSLWMSVILCLLSFYLLSKILIHSSLQASSTAYCAIYFLA